MKEQRRFIDTGGGGGRRICTEKGIFLIIMLSMILVTQINS